VDEVCAGNLANLPVSGPVLDESRQKGPRAALRELQLSSRSAVERRIWVEEARFDAILGSCPRSLTSVKSGLNAYIAFVGEASFGC